MVRGFRHDPLLFVRDCTTAQLTDVTDWPNDYVAPHRCWPLYGFVVEMCSNSGIP